MAFAAIGLDLGQAINPTPLVVVQKVWRPVPGVSSVPGQSDLEAISTRRETHFMVHGIQRLPLGTAYTTIQTFVIALCAQVAAQAQNRPVLLIDAGGPGLPFIDELRRAKPEAVVRAVTITSGDSWAMEGGQVRAGRNWLIGRLRQLLESGRLHVPKDLPEADAFRQELLGLAVEQRAETGRVGYVIQSGGPNDDLLIAASLACSEDLKSPTFVAPVGFVRVGGSKWSPMSEYLETSRRPSDSRWRY